MVRKYIPTKTVITSDERDRKDIPIGTVITSEDCISSIEEKEKPVTWTEVVNVNKDK